MKSLGALLALMACLCLLTACATPPRFIRSDAEIERNARLAYNAFSAGSVEKAAVYYRKALQRARLRDDPNAIGANAYNLAACLVLLQQYQEPDTLLEEAEIEFRRAGIKAPELLLLKARLAYRQGQTASALSLAQSELRSLATQDPLRVQYQILLIEIFYAKADISAAAAELTKVNLKALAAADPRIQAEAALVQAKLALYEKNSAAASKLLDAAADHLQQAGCYNEMAAVLLEAAGAYETAGDLVAALDRLRRAARSLALAGQTERAAAVIAQALMLANQAGQPELSKKLKNILGDTNIFPQAIFSKP